MNYGFKIKLFLLIILNVYISNVFYANDFKRVDNLYHTGKYQEGIKILEKEYDISNPDPEIIWRITRFYFEFAYALPNKYKQEKIKYYTKGMEFSKQFLDIQRGTNLDRAQLIFWYTACYSYRSELIGIRESLDILPVLFNLAGKAIELDPTFAAPYLLLGRIDHTVPSFLGGDKFRMGKNLSMAIKYNPNDMSVLVESGELFLKRDWDSDKKKKMAKKSGKDDGTPQYLSDREYSKILLNNSMKLFESLDNPSTKERNKYHDALDLLKKIK